MGILKIGDHVGIIALSNGLDKSGEAAINELSVVLGSLGINLILPPLLYKTDTIFHASAQERAKMLMDYYQDDKISAIFDVSGGDLANGVLDYLDYEYIAAHPKPFFGYSDLSVVVNALYAKTNTPTYLYQIRNLVGVCGTVQQTNFLETLMGNQRSLFEFEYDFVQGTQMTGIVVGGNIRCLLKLAGTPYMPDFSDKILFLEAMSGDVAKMATYLTQLKQLGVFKQVKGLILGTFTEMEKNNQSLTIIELVKLIIEDHELPMVKTSQIGHGPDSKCLIIGEAMTF
ncbi:MAG: S66 family peptidase [Turicibacter sp.]